MIDSTESTQEMPEGGAHEASGAQKQERAKKYSTEVILAALKASGGMVHVAARKLGCDPKTIYNRAKKTPGIQEAIGDNREYMVDLAETALKAAIIRQEPWAVSMALTKTASGRRRGYGEQPTTSFNLNIDWNALTDDQLQRIANGEDPANVAGNRP